jgi:asparagine synthase (glutamine-hydrolysing)
MADPGAAPPGLDELRRMTAMLTHRGPDGYGLYRDNRVGLGHARLSIIDRLTGAQPLSSFDGRVWLTFNGEIFNYIELRQLLCSLGHKFRTKGDSEVIIECYKRYGAGTWQMLNGQFAFALWDSFARRLWLVRDRLGILPLYYARAGGRLLFGSEAKALFASGHLDASFNSAGLTEIFTNWSALAPHSVFRCVHQILPATAVCFDAKGIATEQRYWQPDPGRQICRSGSIEANAEALRAVLDQAVTLRLRADVPVGAYISGGLDSSVLGSLAVAKVPSLETFGISFEDPRFDETDEQRLVARHLGTRHHEVVCSASAIREALAETVWHCEMPLLRASPAPLFLLSKAVQAAGIKTVLTGEGADELLFGYSIFKEAQIRRFWARQPESRMRAALLGRLHHYVGSEDARSTAMWQSFFSRGLSDTSNPFYSHLLRWENTAWTLRLLAPETRRCYSLEDTFARIERSLPAGWRRWDYLARAQHIEIQAFMTSYLLSCQGDRVAMAHGVEARYPYLDPDVVDFCLRLPKEHMLLGTRDKLVLRRLAQRDLPRQIWHRRKQPFRAPIASSLAEFDCDFMQDCVSSIISNADGIFCLPTVTRFLERVRGVHDRRLSEREQMGLTGVITLSLLHRSFGREFGERARAADVRLQHLPCQVLIDRMQPRVLSGSSP